MQGWERKRRRQGLLRDVLTGVGVLLIATIALTGCAGKHPTSSQAAASSRSRLEQLQTTTARTGSVQPTETMSGIVAPVQNVAISSSLTEPAASVPVTEGQWVHAGQVLAILSTDDLQAELQAAVKSYNEAEAKVVQQRYSAQLAIEQGTASVRNAEATLKQAQATLAQARATYARDQMLYAGGALDRQDFEAQATTVATDEQAVQGDQAELASAIANARANGTPAQGLQAAEVASTIAAAEAARAQIDQYRAEIARATIISPIDGVIVNRNLNPGEYPGSRTLFVIQDIATVFASLNAAGGQTLDVHVGATATITGGSVGARRFVGRVVAVLNPVSPGSTNFVVKVQIANPDHLLRPGMAVTGVVALPRVSGIAIPITAFLDDTHTTVAVSTGGKLRIVHAQLLASDGTTAIVRGLAPGSRVAVNGQAAGPVATGAR